VETALIKERTASINQFQIFSHEYYPAAVAKTTDCSPDNITPPDVANYSGVAPERCLKISTAILSACRCLSNDDISNSIRAIAAINPPSTTGAATGGSLLGLAGNS
jgi:hypothetical protein